MSETFVKNLTTTYLFVQINATYLYYKSLIFNMLSMISMYLCGCKHNGIEKTTTVR